MRVIVGDALPDQLLSVLENEALRQVLVNHKAERGINCFSVRFPTIIHYTWAGGRVLQPDDCSEVS